MADITIDRSESVKATAAEKWAAFKAGLTKENIIANVVAVVVVAGLVALFFCSLGAILFLFPLLAGAFNKK